MVIARRAWLLGVGSGLSAGLGGCAVLGDPPQSAALAAAQPAGLPPRIELREVPFFPQTPYHCGPAALATVLVHAGLAATPEQLADAVFLPSREGSLQAEMLAAARRFGALAVLLPPQLSGVLSEVAAGNPVVVLQNLGLSIAPRWHYAVLVGHDLAAREVVLRSGATERERMSFALFERTWARGAYWAFAAMQPGRLPLTATEVDAVQAAIGFERVASPVLALRAYDSLVARWPGNLLAGLGQGNTRYAGGDPSGAAAAFERVARQHDSAAAWHNLAATRLQLGQTEAARQAALRAVTRARAAEPAWLDAAQSLARQLQSPP
jgi:tetratricopeptide (TPR) repeat protein